MAKQYEIPFLEASAKQSVNVEHSFMTMTQQIKSNSVKFDKDKKKEGVKFGVGQCVQP